ncbi:MAG: hypothetical protein V6Z86_06730, partial [Hyphomicrobiales bacterium]
ELTIGHSRVVAIRTRSGNDVSDIFMREMDALLANNLIELALGTNAGDIALKGCISDPISRHGSTAFAPAWPPVKPR